MGTPVVYSCRLSSVEGGCTVLNEQAAHHIFDKYPSLQLDKIPMEVSVKHQGNCLAMGVSAGAESLICKCPVWSC